MLSGNSLRQTVHTYRASVHQAAKLVAALVRVVRVTAGLAESNDSLSPGLWLTSPDGWLPRTGISSGTLRSLIEYGLPFFTYMRYLQITVNKKLRKQRKRTELITTSLMVANITYRSQDGWVSARKIIVGTPLCRSSNRTLESMLAKLCKQSLTDEYRASVEHDGQLKQQQEDLVITVKLWNATHTTV